MIQEKNFFLLLLLGFRVTTFWLQVHCSINWAIPIPEIWEWEYSTDWPTNLASVFSTQFSWIFFFFFLKYNEHSRMNTGYNVIIILMLPSPLPHHYHTASMELHLRPHIYGCKYKASVSAPMITNGPQFTAWFKKMFSFTVLEWQLRPHQFQLYRNECMHICIMRTEMSADCPGDPTYASTQMTRMAMISQKFSSTPVLMPGAFFIHIKQHT